MNSSLNIIQGLLLPLFGFITICLGIVCWIGYGVGKWFSESEIEDPMDHINDINKQ